MTKHARGSVCKANEKTGKQMKKTWKDPGEERVTRRLEKEEKGRLSVFVVVEGRK